MSATSGTSFQLQLVPDAVRRTKSPGSAPSSLAADAGMENDAQLVQTLLSIQKSVRALTGIKLLKMGFHNGQDELLLALDEQAQIPVSQLADMLSVRPSTVSKMMDRLVERGFVQRTGDVRDARRTLVQITPSGLEAKSLLSSMRQSLEDELISSCPGDVDATVQLLETLAANLKSRLARYR